MQRLSQIKGLIEHQNLSLRKLLKLYLNLGKKWWNKRVRNLLDLSQLIFVVVFSKKQSLKNVGCWKLVHFLLKNPRFVCFFVVEWKHIFFRRLANTWGKSFFLFAAFTQMLSLCLRQHVFFSEMPGSLINSNLSKNMPFNLSIFLVTVSFLDIGGHDLMDCMHSWNFSTFW